jgi:hypothetical protein
MNIYPVFWNTIEIPSLLPPKTNQGSTLMKDESITYRDIIFIFLLAIGARYAFMLFSGVDSYAMPDWARYDRQSDGILAGNFNLEESLFITAPLYSYVIAALKFSFGNNYHSVVAGLQITLSAISVVYLALTAQTIFSERRIYLLTGVGFAIYPITLYYTHQYGQESIFQSLLIISLYYYSRLLKNGSLSSLVQFAIVFSLALLTKSHIILMLPLLMLSLLVKYGLNKNSLTQVGAVVVIVFLITLPYGIYNKIANGTYIISSSGLGGHFVTGHNDDFYNYVVNPPLLGSTEHTRLKSMNFDVLARLAPELSGMTHQQKQARYLQEGLRWSIENPEKLFILSWHNLINFLRPGPSRDHQPFKPWLIALILSAPVFLLAYFEIVRRLHSDFRSHLLICSLFIGMLIFSLGFYTQNRFRVVTIEPYYLMYACSGLMYLINRRRAQASVAGTRLS